MKAISDVKMARAIERIQARFAAAAGEAAAVYEIETVADFHAALIEQAELMAPGTERMVYFCDNEPAVLSEGYGVVKMYRHESYERGATAYVYVDVFSAGKRYCLNVTKSDTDGTWSCTDMVQVMTSDAVHAAITGYGYTTGMVRELDAPDNNGTFSFNDNQSKIYTVMLTDGEDNYTLTVDYRQLNQPAADNTQSTYGFTYFKVATYNGAAAGSIKLRVTVTRAPDGSKAVDFRVVEANANEKVTKVCGYY